MSIRFSSKTLKSVAPIFDRYLMKDKSILKKDKIRLFIKAGRGGNGLYRYNGIGGNGGNIYITGQSNLNFDSFYDRMVLKTHLHAENGQDSTCSKLIGTHGRDLIVRVPVGVEAMNVETKSVIAKCLTTRSKTVIARGGIGGCSKNSFRGSPGEAFFIEFYLKIISNVALFGLPNAGKSSLMKALIPKRKIKIASYPFTTRKPQLCVMKVDEDFESSESPFNISVSDLPAAW
ncbi:hypothetical protein AB6A40_006629 [Gnathostoma spinigerum]|uniref:Uncharacterized protein n=1 Tax=Gnathostoma spinigerum TaxID=75299 RepID=A0ABD6EUJ8_9BILA